MSLPGSAEARLRPALSEAGFDTPMARRKPTSPNSEAAGHYSTRLQPSERADRFEGRTAQGRKLTQATRDAARD